MIVVRVEKQIIQKNAAVYPILSRFCHLSKNLYNFANYHARQDFFKGRGYPSYRDLEKMAKESGQDADYRAMPTAQTAQQTLRLVAQNWNAYRASIKGYRKEPEKYTGKPRIPGYLPKDGGYSLILTNQNCKLRENFICFPSSFDGLTLKTRITGTLQQVRILPRNQHIVIEIVYRTAVPETVPDNGRYMSIDIGLDNLAAITSNTGMTPVIINGKGLKSINKYYNKRKAHYQEIAKTRNQLDYTNQMNQITNQRNRRIEDAMHKASKYIVDLAVRNDICAIVIGNNKDWKRESVLSKKVNQTFVGLPHQRLLEMIAYKGENRGIRVILTEESYTSGTSFLDDEMPIKENYKKSRRVHRGLFISNTSQKINADVNASLQIMKKVFPTAYAASKTHSNGISGIGLCPVVVNVA